ncbi:hypothetical protein AA0111_g7942 [Alternaria arborescens]|uniref:hypothetical protein n=1 Tax=Alternaria arborescens TaxID=156630 RepID=UPI00107576BE|nr:hypothetical protein AA0111_g7942 [Alternaria arborescens]RYO26461.1 hypothetical protein AA0111_g7942 [Alternaria arborescens]
MENPDARAPTILAPISCRKRYDAPRLWDQKRIAKDFATSCDTALVVGPHAADGTELFKM